MRIEETSTHGATFHLRHSEMQFPAHHAVLQTLHVLPHLNKANYCFFCSQRENPDISDIPIKVCKNSVMWPPLVLFSVNTALEARLLSGFSYQHTVYTMVPCGLHHFHRINCGDSCTKSCVQRIPSQCEAGPMCMYYYESLYTMCYYEQDSHFKIVHNNKHMLLPWSASIFQT